MNRLLLALAALALAGCGPRLTDENLRAVRDNMTPKEVESILGPPTGIEHPTELRSPEFVTMPVTYYFYEQDGRTVKLTFVGNRLATGGVEGSFHAEESKEKGAHAR